MYGNNMAGNENAINGDAMHKNSSDSRLYKSSIQILKEDPNIRIVTDVPGISWHIEYIKPPEKKKQGLLSRFFSRPRK